MFPLLLGGGWLHFPLFGRDHLAHAATSMARTVCAPLRGSRRYHDMVEYYSWKLERKHQKNLAYKGFAVCHDAAVAWVVVFQLLRLMQLAQLVFTALK